jgi:hypothetical protein
MSLRGDQHRSAIRAVLDAFGSSADHFVFVGGCVLGLYARDDGAALRTTTDVDCISTCTPWVIQQQILADMCTRGTLAPDKDLACRYRIRGTSVDVDVLSPDGHNVGGVNPWFPRAAEHARVYDVGTGRQARAVTPPYFLATKLVAFTGRGPDAQSSKDLEDIVALAVEVEDLREQVEHEGIGGEIGRLWSAGFERYSLNLDDLPDMVDSHLHRDDRAHRERVLAALKELAGSIT